jgi:hypothetical protein
MGTSRCRKSSSKTIPDDFSPLCGNFSLRPFGTQKMSHKTTSTGFSDLSQNLDLERIFTIIGIYYIVDIQGDKFVTVVDIDSFGIVGNFIQRAIFRQNFGIFVITTIVRIL